MEIFNAIEKTKELEKIVVDGIKRKYYRLGRGGKWYGGISTADCCGCNLKCVFCWSGKPRDFPQKIGNFYTPEEVAEELIKCARKNNYNLLRISGNEPTIGREHLLKLLEILSKEKYLFILETNGVLLDKDFIFDLRTFKKLHIRLSLKGTTKEEFSKLTGANPETFDLILDNIRNIFELNLKFNVAIMLSFSPEKNFLNLKEKLKKISSKIEIEEEYVFLYPKVLERLRKAKIVPLIAYKPDEILEKLI